MLINRTDTCRDFPQDARTDRQVKTRRAVCQLHNEARRDDNEAHNAVAHCRSPAAAAAPRRNNYDNHSFIKHILAGYTGRGNVAGAAAVGDVRLQHTLYTSAVQCALLASTTA